MKQFIFGLLALFALLAYSPPCLAFESNHERQKTEFCAQIKISYPVAIFVEDAAENATDVCFAGNADNQTEIQDLSKYFTTSQKNKDNLGFNWGDFINNLPCLKGRLCNTKNTKISHDKESTNHFRKNYTSYWCDFYCRA